MITIEHSAELLKAFKGDVVKFRKAIAYLLVPDAIRRYTGPRPYSHFEMYNGQTSWMEFPTEDLLKVVNKENIFEYCKGHLIEGGYPKCVIGEETQIDVFEEHNQHLSGDYYYGIKNHLIQDIAYDNYVRRVIDCTKRYDDIFVFNGEQMDGAQMRALVQRISDYDVYLLAKELYEKYGITYNQEFLKENIFTELQRVYSEDLAEGTAKYMNIPENINGWITAHDFSHLNESPVEIASLEQLHTETTKQLVLTR